MIISSAQKTAAGNKRKKSFRGTEGKRAIMTEHELNDLTSGIIGVAIEVHNELGPGLFEKIYRHCLKMALEDAGYHVEAEVSIPIIFRGKLIDNEGYRIDLLVNDTVILEIKSVSALSPLFEKQLVSYLRLTYKPCGLLMNFNSTYLKHGIKRIKNGYLPL